MAIPVGVMGLWWVGVFFLLLFPFSFVELFRYSVWRLSQHFLGDCQIFMQVSEISIWINEGCSARTMTNLFHLPAQQEEAAIPTKREPTACFSVPRFPKASQKYSRIFLFVEPDLYILPIPRTIYIFFLNEKRQEWTNGLVTIFKIKMTEFLSIHTSNIVLHCNDHPRKFWKVI